MSDHFLTTMNKLSQQAQEKKRQTAHQKQQVLARMTNGDKIQALELQNLQLSQQIYHLTLPNTLCDQLLQHVNREIQLHRTMFSLYMTVSFVFGRLVWICILYIIVLSTVNS